MRDPAGVAIAGQFFPWSGRTQRASSSSEEGEGGSEETSVDQRPGLVAQAVECRIILELFHDEMRAGLTSFLEMKGDLPKENMGIGRRDGIRYRHHVM